MTSSFKNVLFALPLTGALLVPSAFGQEIDGNRANFDAGTNQSCAIKAIRANMPHGAEIGVNYDAEGPIVEGKYCREGNACDSLSVAVTMDDTTGVIGAKVTSNTMYFKDEGGKSRVVAESSSSNNRSNVSEGFAGYIAGTDGLIPVTKGDTSVIGFNPQSNVTQVYGTQSLFAGCKRDATKAYDQKYPASISFIDDGTGNKPTEYYTGKIEAGEAEYRLMNSTKGTTHHKRGSSILPSHGVN